VVGAEKGRQERVGKGEKGKRECNGVGAEGSP